MGSYVSGCTCDGVEVLGDRFWHWESDEGSPDLHVHRVRLVLTRDVHDAGSDVDMWLLGPGSVPPPEGRPWEKALQSFSAPRVTIELHPPVSGRPPVVVPVYASDWPGKMPGSVQLSVRQLWGCTGWGDMYGLASSLLADGEEPAYASWATSVWVELAGTDEALLREMIEERVQPSQWRTFLEAYAIRRGWHGQALERVREVLERTFSWHALSLMRAEEPPSWLFRLWAEGVIDLVGDRGIEAHSAVLVALKWEDMVCHRIWRGQIRSLFPLIDQARLLLARQHGLAGGDREPVELPELRAAARNEALGVSSVLLREAIAELQYARNRLAHYEPLDWDTYRSVVAALYRLENMAGPAHPPTTA